MALITAYPIIGIILFLAFAIFLVTAMIDIIRKA